MKRVLLIDDSVTIHRVIDICLDKEKFNTEKTFSADDAIAKLKANSFDIILLDNKLEGINLPDFTAKIRSLSPTSWIILLTGAFDTFSGANLQASGADDFIFKPFDSNALEQKIIYGLENADMSFVPAIPSDIADENNTEILIPETENTETELTIIDISANEITSDAESEIVDLRDEESIVDEVTSELNLNEETESDESDIVDLIDEESIVDKVTSELSQSEESESTESEIVDLRDEESIVDEVTSELNLNEETESDESDIVDLIDEESIVDEVTSELSQNEETESAESEIADLRDEESIIDEVTSEPKTESDYSNEDTFSQDFTPEEEQEEQQPEEAVTDEEKAEINNLFNDDDAEIDISNLQSEDLDYLMKELHDDSSDSDVSPAIFELKSIVEDTDGEPDINELIPLSTFSNETRTALGEFEFNDTDNSPLEGEVGFEEDTETKQAIDEVPLDGEFEDLTQLDTEEVTLEQTFELDDAEIRIVRGDDTAEEYKSLDDIDFSSLTEVTPEELLEEVSNVDTENYEPMLDITEITDDNSFELSSLISDSEDDLSNSSDVVEDILEEDKTTEDTIKETLGEEAQDELNEDLMYPETVIEDETIELDELFGQVSEINTDEHADETETNNTVDEELEIGSTDEFVQSEESESLVEEQEATELNDIEQEDVYTESTLEEEAAIIEELFDVADDSADDEQDQVLSETDEPQLLQEDVDHESMIVPDRYEDREPTTVATPNIAPFSRDEMKAAVQAAIDSDLLKEIIREVLAEKIEAAVKDSLPTIAERIITEEIERLKRGE
jgi:DNA-binding response OmpR family regulator